MFNHAIQSPLQALSSVFRGSFKPSQDMSWSFDFGRDRTPHELRHLDDRILKDIGYDRIDKLEPATRHEARRLMSGQLW